MLQVFRGRQAVCRLVVAVLVTGGVLLGGTAAVAGAPSAPLPSQGQAPEHAASSSRPAWDHPTTLGVHPNWNQRLPGPTQTPTPHLSGEQAANVSSGNWSGLAQVGATYTAVSASWTVPNLQSTPSPAVSSSWIGIDGFSNQNLIQAGTEQDVSGGVGSYYAWWEILPAPETEIGGVSPGDHMSASIFKVSGSTWTIDISDLTSSQNFSQNFTYSGAADSAEWIEEMTSVSGGSQPPLANFGTANFTNLGYTTPNPTANTPTLIRMVGSSSTIAYPTIPGAADLNVTYGQPSTATTVTASPNPVGLGSSVTYSASVTGGTPSGSVTFSTGSTALCTATLSSGSASCSSAAAPLGSDLVYGTYSGGAGYRPQPGRPPSSSSSLRRPRSARAPTP